MGRRVSMRLESARPDADEGGTSGGGKSGTAATTAKVSAPADRAGGLWGGEDEQKYGQEENIVGGGHTTRAVGGDT